MNKTPNHFAEFITKARHARTRRRVVALLSVVVLLFTMNRTTFRADAWAGEPKCGVEEHLHDETCFDAEDSLICGLDEHVHDDGCYGAEPEQAEAFELGAEDDLGETAVEPVDAPVDEAALMIDGEIAEAPEDGEALESGEVSYEYEVGDQSPVYLSDILRAVGLEDLGDADVGQVVDDAHPADMIRVEAAEGDTAIYAAQDFDCVELAVITDGDFHVIRLLNAVLPEVEPEDEAPAEEIEVEIEQDAEPEAVEEEIVSEEDEAEEETEVGNIDEAEAEEETLTEESEIDGETVSEEEPADAEAGTEEEEPADTEAEIEEEEPADEKAEIEEESAIEEVVADENPAAELGTEEANEEDHIEETGEENEGEPEEEAMEEPEEAPAVERYSATVDISEMTAPFSLRALMSEAERAEVEEDRADADAEAPEEISAEDESDETAVETPEETGEDAPAEARNAEDPAEESGIDAWAISFDEALLSVERAGDDYAVAPLERFERAGITVTTPDAVYALTLVDAAEAEAPVETELEIAAEPTLYAAAYDLSEVELPLSLPAMMAELAPEAVEIDGGAEWIVECDDALLHVDESYNVTPVADFEETLLAVTAGDARFEFTLLNCAERPALPALDLGLAVVTPVDEALGFDEDAAGSADLLTEAEAEAACAAVESALAEEAAAEPVEAETEEAPEASEEVPVEATEAAIGETTLDLSDEAPEAEPEDIAETQPARRTELPREGIVTTEQRTEYQAFSISLENVDAADYEDGFNVAVTLPEALEADEVRLYRVLEDASGDTAVEAVPLEDAETEDGALNGFAFVADSLEGRETYVLSYTVDFEYAEYPFSIPGGSSIALSALFDALRIDRDVADVTDMTFSSPELVSVARDGGDWRLTSLAPFLTEETLTIDFANGDVIVIRVTDDMAGPYDLGGAAASWLDLTNSHLRYKDEAGNWVDLFVNGQPVPGTTLPEYAEFDMNIVFKVPGTSVNGFTGIKDGETVEYQLPTEWVRTLKPTNGRITITGQGERGSYEVDSNGKLTITYDEDLLRNNRYGIGTEVHLTGNMNLTTTTETTENVKINYLGQEITTAISKRKHAENNINIKKLYTGMDHAHADKNGEGAVTALNYQLTVFAGKFDGTDASNQSDLTGVKISDVFSTYEKFAFEKNASQIEADAFKSYITYGDITATLKDYQGNPVTDREVRLVRNTGTNGEAEFRIYYTDTDTEAPFCPDELIVIDYSALIDKEMYEHNPRGPWDEMTDDTDHYARNGKSSGSDINIEDLEGTSYESRSWISRFLENDAEVETDTIGETTATLEVKDGKEVEKERINLEKTWLWKVGDPDKNNDFQNSYHVSINEGPYMDIRGWTFTDLVGDNDQRIISDVKIYFDEAKTDPYMTLSLDDLRNNNIPATSPFYGSTLEKIVFKFPNDALIANYRVFYKAEYNDGKKNDDNKLTCRNSATLVQSGDDAKHDNDTYGVYESHNIAGATVTKHEEDYSVYDGTIDWVTTIDKGIDAQYNSTYYDILGWKRIAKDNTEEVSRVDKTAAEYKDHYIDSDRLNLRITTGVGETGELTENVDYTVTVLDPDNYDSWIDEASYWENADCRSPYGFKVVFLRSVTGPIYLHYTSIADFGNVAHKEQFINHLYYYKDPSSNDNPFWDQDIHYHTSNDLLEKAVQKITLDGEDVPIVAWHISINNKRFESGNVAFEDIFPEGLEFDLTRDLQMRWVVNKDDSTDERFDWYEAYTGLRNPESIDKWPTTVTENMHPVNDYFRAYVTDVEVDGVTRKKLRIEIDSANINEKTVEFNLYTHPTLESLAEINDPNGEKTSLYYLNEGWLYSNSTSHQNHLLAKSSADATISYEMLGKNVQYDSTTAPYAKYTVSVNPGGIEMAPNSHRITVQDILDANSTLRLRLPAGLKVLNTHTNQELTRVENLEGDLSDTQYRLTINGNSVGSVTGFTLDVPDATPLRITYEAYAPGVVGDTMVLSNNVTLTSEETELVTKVLTGQSEFITSSGTGSVTNRVSVRKVSAADTTKLLRDAKFSVTPLYNLLTGATGAANCQRSETEGSGDEAVTLNNYGEIVTGANGVGGNAREDTSLIFKLDDFLLYEVKETEAPEGFGIPGDGVVGYFAFFTPSQPNGFTPPDGKTTYSQWVRGLKEALRGNAALNLDADKDIELINSGYQDFEFFAVDAPEVDVRLIKVNADTGAAVEGARFRLYRRNGERYDVIGTLKDVALDDDKTFEIPEDGLTLKGLGYGSYKLVETEAPRGYNLAEAPVYFDIDSTGRVVDGTDDETIAVFGTADDGTATITVPNKPGYVLPSTGGMGTLAYILGGLLLILGAAILLLLRGRGNDL